MNTIMEQESSDFGARIPMVGRKAEMEDLRAWLHEERGRHFVYYRALGGLGKTRILQELQKMAVQAGPGFCFSGIIDLYHTDLHSTSRIERAIAQGLDPERKYFGEYWRRRREFEMLREWGADPQVIEDRRVELSAAFVRACRDLAEDAKLVICFDTVELLQSESSVVEQMAGLETMDVRIKPWLLHHLAELRRNVLVVFAGRPRVPLPGDEERDPQARLEADMRQAFGDDLRVIELGPLTLDETGQFVAVLAAQSDVGTLTLDDRLSVVHLLTGGRPILLHLVVDLLAHLAQEPRLILDLFDRHAGLVGAPPDDPRVAAAREEIERELVHAVFAEEVLLGNYLYRIALLPKGVDAEILGQVLGLSNDGAHDLLRHLAPLSFVKQHVPSQIDDQEADERFFLHDEMYRLLRRPDVVPNLRVNELDVAQRVIERYYDPQIELLTQVVSASLPDERAPQRERLHRLLVDRLYYLLVCDVQKGYEAYRELSDEANRHRQAGLSMRLLDEFLRFYNAPERWEMLGRGKLWHPDERVPERREIPAQAFLLYKQVIRDSVLMWVERLYHWGQHNMAIDFASQALDDPGRVYLRESQDIDILANICALWANARALVNGYEPKTIERAQAMLRRLPPLEGCTPGEALARARLSVAIGYRS